MIKSEMTYTKEAFNDFAIYNIKKNKEMRFIYVCAALILAFTIVMFTVGDIISGIVYGIIGLIFASYGWFMKLIINHNNKKNIGTTDFYEFYDDKFLVSSKDKNGVEIASSSIVYSRLFKITKYKNYAYIYVNKAVAYIISKQSFESEQDFDLVFDKISLGITEQKIKNATPVVYGGYNVTPPNEEPIKDVGDPVPPPEVESEEHPDINEITDTVDANAQETVKKPKTKTTRTKKTESTTKTTAKSKAKTTATKSSKTKKETLEVKKNNEESNLQPIIEDLETSQPTIEDITTIAPDKDGE